MLDGDEEKWLLEIRSAAAMGWTADWLRGQYVDLLHWKHAHRDLWTGTLQVALVCMRMVSAVLEYDEEARMRGEDGVRGG